MKLVACNCPSCGGNLSYDIENKMFFCPFCDKIVLLDKENEKKNNISEMFKYMAILAEKSMEYLKILKIKDNVKVGGSLSKGGIIPTGNTSISYGYPQPDRGKLHGVHVSSGYSYCFSGFVLTKEDVENIHNEHELNEFLSAHADDGKITEEDLQNVRNLVLNPDVRKDLLIYLDLIVAVKKYGELLIQYADMIDSFRKINFKDNNFADCEFLIGDETKKMVEVLESEMREIFLKVKEYERKVKMSDMMDDFDGKKPEDNGIKVM